MGRRQGRAAVAAALIMTVVLTACGQAEEAAELDEELIRRTFDEESSSEPAVDGSAALSPATEEAGEPDPPELTPLETPAEPDEGEDPPLATGRDWDEVARRLFDIQTMAGERRDLDVARLGMVENCQCFARMADSIDELVTYDVRRSTKGPERLESVKFVAEELGVVTLEVEFHVPRLAIVDGEGNEYATREPMDFRQRWTLVSGGKPEGPWRLGIARTLGDEE